MFAIWDGQPAGWPDKRTWQITLVKMLLMDQYLKHSISPLTYHTTKWEKVNMRKTWNEEQQYACVWKEWKKPAKQNISLEIRNN